MPTYTIEGKRIRTDAPLSDADIDEIAAGLKEKPGFWSQVKDVVSAISPAAPPTLTTLQARQNLAAGLVRGAGSIGATLLRPFETAEESAQRRADITAGLEMMGAQPNTLAFQTGKLGGEMAGTAGVGNVLAVPFRVAAPTVSAALEGGTAATKIPLWLRAAGGATTGAVSGGLIEPTATNVTAGGILGGGIPILGAGVRSARNWLSPELQGQQAVLNTLGNDAATINALTAANRAAPGQRAREIAGGVSDDLAAYQTLLARAEQQTPIKTATAARAAESKANEATLAALAGGETQTAARAAVKQGRAALAEATAPLREAALADVDRATTLVQKALKARGESAAAVQDVRKFTDMADRAVEWAKNWTSSATRAGAPAAARPPVRYTYPGQLAERAEGVAETAAGASLKAGAEARAAENTATFMAARGVKPVEVNVLTDAIDAQLRKPEVVVNKQLVKALENVKEMGLQFAGNSNLLGAAEYYALRKEGINSAVKSALGTSGDPAAEKRFAATILSTLKRAVDPKLGPKFKTYLDAYSEGARELSKQKLAAEALKLYQKSNKNSFIALIEGNDPKRVLKIMGGGVEDIADAMGADYAALKQIADQAKLQINIGKQAKSVEGQTAASKAIAEVQRSFRIPNMLSAKTTFANTVFSELEGKINRKALETIRKAAESGADMNTLITGLPPAERSKVIQAFRSAAARVAVPASVNMLAESEQ